MSECTWADGIRRKRRRSVSWPFGHQSSNMSAKLLCSKSISEIRRIIDEQYARAQQLLRENRDKVEMMTKTLLDWETIDAEQIADIMAGRPPRPPKPSPPPIHLPQVAAGRRKRRLPQLRSQPKKLNFQSNGLKYDSAHEALLFFPNSIRLTQKKHQVS